VANGYALALSDNNLCAIPHESSKPTPDNQQFKLVGGLLIPLLHDTLVVDIYNKGLVDICLAKEDTNKPDHQQWALNNSRLQSKADSMLALSLKGSGKAVLVLVSDDPSQLFTVSMPISALDLWDLPGDRPCVRPPNHSPFPPPIDSDCELLHHSWNFSGKEMKVISYIQAWLPSKKFSLLYKGSRDGFIVDTFHEKCDNKGPTLVLIQSGLDGKLDDPGYIFGGYNPVNWVSITSAAVPNADAFLFTITNPSRIAPTKFLPKPDATQLVVHPSDGPQFGYSPNDISTFGRCATPCVSLGSGFMNTTGRGPYVFTGSQEYSIYELEIYQVL